MAARPGRGPVRPHRRAARRDGTPEFVGRERDRPRGADHPPEAPDLDHERLLADYDAAMECALAEVKHAFQIADGDWRERTRAALARLLELAARHPGQTRLCTIDVFAAGPAGLARRDVWMRRFTSLCDAGYAAADAPSPPTGLASPLATGAIFELIRTHAASGRLDVLEEALATAELILLGPHRDAA